MFFEDDNGNAVTVNQERYQGVFQQFFSSLKHRCADTISLQWFQQGVAPAHTAVKTLEYLRECMGDRVTFRGVAIAWPPSRSAFT